MTQTRFREAENEINNDFINQIILTKQNPFPRNPVTSKDYLPEFCLGRTEEIGIIKNAIEKVSNDPGNKSAWIPINGDGGTGKSTIALYIYNKIRNGHSRDLDVDHLEGAYINIPADPRYLTISYIYKKIIEDLGDSPESYPYFLGFKFVNKLCEIIFNIEEIREEFEETFKNAWSKISSCDNYRQFLIRVKKKAPKFTNELIEFVTEYDYLIQPKIQLNLIYIQNLIELISGNKKVRRNACEFILGRNIKDEVEARDMIENFVKTTNFLFDRSCLMVIMDNLENLSLEEKTFRDFFKFLQAFRNNINNCLLLTIGSTKFWEFFRKAISMSEWNMIEGFKYEELSLISLSEEDASRILMRHMSEFWGKNGSISPPVGKDRNYPFSKSSFRYIYEINDRNLRDTLKKCNRIIEKFKESNQILYYKNLETAIYTLRPLSVGTYLFENEINFLLKFLAKFTDRNNLSRKVEIGLVRAFNVIKDNQEIKYLSNVEHEPSIHLTDGSLCKPDVYLTLFGQKSIKNLRWAEIQVKTHFPTNYVKLPHVKSSIDMLKDGKIQYLHFITLSPLDNKILQELKKFKIRVGRITPLKSEEPAYLVLLITEFSKIFFRNEVLDYNTYVGILKKIGIDIPELFEEIKRIPILDVSKPGEKQPPPTQPKQIPLPVTPITPLKKIYNPKVLEGHLIELFESKGLIKKKQDIIDEMKKIAGSVSVINNSISNLQKLNRIQYSRSKPQGWSLKN